MEWEVEQEMAPPVRLMTPPHENLMYTRRADDWGNDFRVRVKSSTLFEANSIFQFELGSFYGVDHEWDMRLKLSVEWDF